MRKWVMTTVLALAASWPATTLAQWYAIAEFTPLLRADSSSAVFQRNETVPVTTTTTVGGVTTTTTTPSLVGSTVLLSADNLPMDYEPAGRITIGNRLEQWLFGLEASYLRMDSFKSAANVLDGTGLMASPFSVVGSVPNASLDNNLSARVDYQSQMQSAEFHVTQIVSDSECGDTLDTSFLWGIRAIAIDESLNYVTTNATMTNDVWTWVDNRLIGPQVGLFSRRAIPHGLLSLKLKGALLRNSISETVNVNGTLGHIDDSKASLAGECAVDCWYHPLPWLAFRVGYQCLGMTGVGLATENLVGSATVTGVKTGTVFYHGPCLGLVLNY